MMRPAWQRRKAVVPSFENKARILSYPHPYMHLRASATAECTEEVGLVGTVETQRVVMHSRSRCAAPLPRRVFEHTLVNNDALAGNRPLERENVPVAMRREV